jgi:pimeloyl-ACP methyl ester carboxylesterase
MAYDKNAMTAMHAMAAPDGVAISADGTRIGYRKLGQGPAIVLVHGSISSHAAWMPVASMLALRHTCYVMDRRGRGMSHDGQTPYAIEREYEDIVAVLKVAGPGVALLGHSFGAICCLGAALHYPVSKLILYEPPLPVEGSIADGYLEPFSRAVAAGQFSHALKIGLTHFVRLPAAAIATMQSTPQWKEIAKMTPSWGCEVEAIDALDHSIEPYRKISCPALLLMGENSPEYPLRSASLALAGTLLRVRVEAMQGQSHMAMRTVPRLVSDLVDRFLAN